MNLNPNCDGDKCRKATGEVRVLPTGGDGNAILCFDCFTHEIDWRRERNRDNRLLTQFDLPVWSTLNTYTP